MYRDVTLWTWIRRRVLIGGASQSQIARETGLGWRTVRRMIEFPLPPQYRGNKAVAESTLRPFFGLIDGIVKEDRGKPQKQQRNATQIWERLKEDHAFSGGLTIVRKYVREARHQPVCGSISDPVQSALSTPVVSPREAAELTYLLIQSAPKKEAIRLLRAMFGGSSPKGNLKGLARLLEPFAIQDAGEELRQRERQSAFDWMRRVLQGELFLDALAVELGLIPNLKELVAVTTERRLSDRNRALAVLARAKGIDLNNVCAFLNIAPRTAIKFWRHYQEGGIDLLMARPTHSEIKSDKDSNKQALFALLHSPPSTYGINRTTWRLVDLKAVMRRQGSPLGRDVIQTIIKEAGYRWRSARVVLTSKDPKYRTKVDAIKKLLSELGPDEAFFSIDEFGPFAVKKRGGVKRVAPGQEHVIPRWQKSRGCMIITAALELSKNQVTHFYSRAKNTEEMIKMADLLRAQYCTCRTIYLSWDAASWHVSRDLLAHLKRLNQEAERDAYPIVKMAPLPARAQFLNVIESVFSGMARAIIHNSDYPSVGAAKDAINLYFAERNAYFSDHPKRAGQKIWGEERVPSEFLEGQNCKDPLCR